MKTNNVLLLVGNNKEDLDSFESKLMLLRDVDTILHSNVQDAFGLSQKYVPDSVIIFIDKEDENVFELCKSIKGDIVLKNTPILFVMQEFNQEITLSGFDAGISDYISFPLSDSDVLVRVIWALQKSEDLKKIEKQEKLLSNLNVVYKNIGIYTQKYTKEVFKNELDSARKYKKKVCLMSVSLDNDFQEVVPLEKLAAVIKKSTRNSDLIGLVDKKTFLVLMPKTTANGAATVYHRIQNSLNDITASASAIEYSDELDFDKMSLLLMGALNQALAQVNNLKTIKDINEVEIEVAQDEKELIEEVKEPKNYKLFAQAFNKKIENVIEPVFEESQKRYKEKHAEHIQIETQIDQKECIFILNDEHSQLLALLRIVNEGLSKVVVEVGFTKDGETINDVQKVDLKEFNEEYLLNLLDNLNEQFEGALNV